MVAFFAVLLTTLSARGVEAQPLKALFAPGTVITVAVEHGSGPGSPDYEFVVVLRRFDAQGLEFDWSMAAPRDWRGSRRVRPADLADAPAINDWYANGDSGERPGASSMAWPRTQFAALKRGAPVTLDIVGDAKHTFRKTGAGTESVLVDGKPTRFKVVYLKNEKGNDAALLDYADFPIGIASQGKWSARTVSIETAGFAKTVRRALTAGRFTAYGVHFNTNSADLQRESEPTLAAVAKYLKEQPKARLRIEGHTDGIGGEAHNQDLSERRAASVKRHLVEKGGIDAGRLTTAGFGKSKPVADNATLAGRAKNRRVVFEIVR